MALVVFLRGVNVGRHKRFLPAQLARDLGRFDVVNVGAAGTFVVRAAAAQTVLRREILHSLAFDAGIAIVKGSALVAFVDSKPFGPRPPAAHEQRFVTVLLEGLRKSPPLPMSVPPGEKWQVKVVGVSGQLVASLWRRDAARPLYPNAAVEKEIGPGTTRNWNTLEKICEILMRERV